METLGASNEPPLLAISVPIFVTRSTNLEIAH